MNNTLTHNSHGHQVWVQLLNSNMNVRVILYGTFLGETNNLFQIPDVSFTKIGYYNKAEDEL